MSEPITREQLQAEWDKTVFSELIQACAEYGKGDKK